ncbi:hypothetical protein ACFW1A_21645 [Kitasatospora sp. NPDC058965]|uniref:hypothetical protein n=1 Tax=Kitasatospora sp. NPDC058965 TaxID=3346682 RepID=UPI00368CC88C
MPQYIPPTRPRLIAARDTFDMYGTEPPTGDWPYRLDDFGIAYGPGDWPFHRRLQRTEWHPANPLITHQVDTGATEQARVRLSPDPGGSWYGRNHYVSISPAGEDVHADLTLYIARQGMGAMVRRATLVLTPRSGAVTVPDGCPPPLRPQAEERGRRLLAFLSEACEERDAGGAEPHRVLHSLMRKDDPNVTQA